MSISSALSNAVSGLSITSRKAEAISDNIANALTPGYMRKSVEVEARVVGGNGRGVYTSAIVVSQDPVLTAERRRLQSSASEAGVDVNTLDRLTAALGTPDDAHALANRAALFETSLSAAAADPSSTQKQANVLDAASGLAQTLNRIATENQQIRMDSDAEIALQVDAVNTALVEIKNLNTEIKIKNIGGGDVSALTNQRQLLIDEVASIIPLRTGTRDGGEVALYSQSGQMLLEGEPATLGFTPSGVITANLSVGTGGLSGLTVDGQAVTIGQGGGRMDGGSLSALFAARDVTIPAFDTQLDALAEDLITRFQDPTVDTTLAVGDAGLFTDATAAFVPGNEVGLAGRIAVNAAVDPSNGGDLWRLRDGVNAVAQGPVGDATILQNLLDSSTRLVTPGAALGIAQPKSFAGFAAELTSQAANAAERADQSYVNLSVQADTMVAAEAAAIGVDSDAELQKLLAVEQAYAANARVISVVDELMRRLLEI